MAILDHSVAVDIPLPAPGTAIRFYLNGQEWILDNPDPTLLLVDWLRTPTVGLTGTKKGCGQGGCGACTVMLSRWDGATGEVRHEAINSCLRPVCSLDGVAITTTEGAGSVETVLNPVQYRIAKDNGSQCGYCTPGWVMTMTAFLAAHPGRKPTQLEIERMFDGNLCRCTGYRPILYAMRHFASDWTSADEEGCMECLTDPAVKHTDDVAAPNPPAAFDPPPLRISGGGITWHRPVDLEELFDLLRSLPAEQVRLVNGNTSIGIYDRFQDQFSHLIDISLLRELKILRGDAAGHILGGGLTYSELLEYLDVCIAGGDTDDGTAALRYMAHRTAGTIVRNVASLAGNTMLVVRHMLAGPPFPSDLFTALATLNASVVLAEDSDTTTWRTLPILDFAEAWQTDMTLRRSVLMHYVVPRTRPQPQEYVRTYKVALREVNAHSIVNAGCRVLFDNSRVTEAAVVLGGIAPVAFHAVRAEAALVGQDWVPATLAAALSALRGDVDEALDRWQLRLRGVPDEGFTDSYRRHLAESYLYQFFVHVAAATDTVAIPPEIASAGTVYERPLSRGTQSIPPNQDKAPVGLPFVKLDAFLQATGEAKYIHDLPLPPRGVNGAFVLSSRALARFAFCTPDEPLKPVDAATLTAWLQQRYPGVVALLTAGDVPAGTNNRTGWIQTMLGGVDPLLAEDTVEWYGQPIALLLAEDETYAIAVAHYVRSHCLVYAEIGGDGAGPLLTIEQAQAQNSLLVDTLVPPYNHILYVERPQSQMGWVGTTGTTMLGQVPCQVVNGSQRVGSQAHFYMETHSVLAVPGERGQMTVNPSSQSPDSVQHTVASVLGVPISSVALSIKRIGGGYGGKTTRSPFVAAPAALAAARLKRPVRIAVRREEDMEMIGHRHPFRGDYSIAVATGEGGGAPKGRIMGLFLDLYSNGGATYDCSFTVMDCVQMRIDSGYMVPNWKTIGTVARTNLASNTAFRSMGLIQGILILEDAIAHAAHEMGMRAEDLRELNLYQPGQQTIVGTVLGDCYMSQVWQYLKTKADFDSRAVEVDRFNQQNRWRKRGIAMIPVQYGAGYNAAFLEQAGALVDVADEDGSVLVHQGGVEIGQGLATKIAQIAAEALNVPLTFITLAPTDLQVVPNPVSTGASTGTGFNAEAVWAACDDLRKRLEAYCMELLKQNGEAWCVANHVDFWNYPEGWSAVIPGQAPRLLWQAIVGSAYFDRVDLSAQSRVSIPGGSNPALNLHYASDSTAEHGVDQFTGYTFSAACSEVEIDVLTGETTILRTDLVYDIGDSLNSAIDIGQVEGAFVQGAGYVLTEEIVTQPDGPDAGRLNSNNTWGYKLPATTTIPLQFNVGFYPRLDAGGIGAATRDMVLGSKEVGEPPLVLAASVYLALKNAILAARRDRGRDEWFLLEAPATVQRVRRPAWSRRPTCCFTEKGDVP